MGGIDVDMDCRVLDNSGRIIPGLFAVGEVTGSDGINGKAALEGTFLGPGIYMGRIAGRRIAQDVAARTDGSIRLSPGTLYRSIQRMLEDGLIVETDERPSPEDDDERRRYYRLTALGTAVAKAEAARLMDLVKMARARGLAPRKV